MAPISTLLILIPIFVEFTKIKACSPTGPAHLRPYPDDIITEFPPLRFPWLESAVDVSRLEQNLCDLDKHIEAMKLPEPWAMLGGSDWSDCIAGDGSLESTTKVLMDHLLSAAVDLEDFSLYFENQSSIDKDFYASNCLRPFETQVEILRLKIIELLKNLSQASIIGDGTALDAGERALTACGGILELFNDERCLFWNKKLTFYPHLMSLTGLYATAAATVIKFYPDNAAPSQGGSMELLRTTILKYHPLVKMERLSKLTVNQYDSDKEPQFSKGGGRISKLSYRCPKFQIIEQKPSSAFKACIRGDTSIRDYTRTHDYSIMRSNADLKDALPNWFEDTVSGAIFCGWEGCWYRLYEYIEHEMDKLTKLALKLIPLVNPPSQRLLPTTELLCQQNAYVRFSYLLSLQHSEHLWKRSTGFGCHKGYCWKYCFGSPWCYTKNPWNEEYAPCDKNEDCCSHWDCHGKCGKWGSFN